MITQQVQRAAGISSRVRFLFYFREDGAHVTSLFIHALASASAGDASSEKVRFHFLFCVLICRNDG